MWCVSVLFLKGVMGGLERGQCIISSKCQTVAVVTSIDKASLTLSARQYHCAHRKVLSRLLEQNPMDSKYLTLALEIPSLRQLKGPNL